MGSFSLIHWIILGLFILLLFGGSRFSSAMKDVAKGLKSFKEGLADDEDEKKQRYEEQRRLDASRPIDVTPEQRRTEEPAVRPDDRQP